MPEKDNVIRPAYWQHRATSREYFGGCPTCGVNDGYVQTGGEQWFICQTHKTRWRAGSTLQRPAPPTHDDVSFAQLVIRTYDEVRPVFPAIGGLGSSDDVPNRPA